ncbi:ER membrane protein complex subunit 1 [Dermatophagoides pteronyssinus]|uniref:ER membrane protein complex subunit 1 n=1 Tax=Dermatophagoides pteronyssinus TaxID=6956 RepID=UPI003F668362
MKQLNELFLYMIILKLLFQLADCLYEDQIGKFDWRQQFVGRVDHVLRASDIWQDHQLLITSSHSGSLSGLYLRNGSINWRHLLENSSSIDFLSSWPKSSPSTMDFSCPVLSVNGHGRWIRCWKTSGILLSEHFLPNDFLNEIDNDPSNFDLLFKLIRDPQQQQKQQPALLIVKISRKNYLMEFFHYQFRQRKLQSLTRLIVGKWLDTSKCHMITSEHMICIDQKDRGFQFIDLNNVNDDGDKSSTSTTARQFKRIPLSTFGLTTAANLTENNNNNDKIRIQLLPELFGDVDKTTTISKAKSNYLISKYFAINLGNGQGIVLFKIVSDDLQDNSGGGGSSSIRLVKVFPYAHRITIIPLISSSQESSISNQNEIDQQEFGVVVMFTKSEPIPYEDQNDARNEQKVFAIKLAIFHLESWNDITTTISSKSILFEFGGRNSLSPVASNGKLVKRLDKQWSVDRFEIIPIRTMVPNNRLGRNQFRYTYKLLLTTLDGTMIVTNLMGKINWAREEALAEINSLVMIDLPLSEDDATLEQEYGFDERNTNIVSMFIHRIRSQIIQLMSFIRQSYHSLMHSMIILKQHRTQRSNQQQQQQLDDEISFTIDQQQDQLQNDDSDDTEEILIRDYFGFHKVIIARTKSGKIFALDTITGRIIWTRYEPWLAIHTDNNDDDVQFPIWIQRNNAHYTHSAVCTILNSFEDQKRTFLYSFDPVTGIILDSKWLPYRTIQAMLLQTIYDDNTFQRPLLLLDSEYNAYLYPDTMAMKKLFQNIASNHFMMILNKTDALLTGYSFAGSNVVDNGPRATPVWQFRLPHETNKLISIKSIFKRPHEMVHSQGRVLGDRNVLYKYLNPNLVAILVESLDSQDKSFITMYLIDSITGNIIYSIVHRRTRCPCQVVHSENSIIYSYYNDKMRRNELSSIELYEGFNQINSTAFSSIGRDLWAIPNVEQKSFIFPTGIGIMTDTETLKGITSKHILISLPTGGILELPRAFLDPRRPIRPTQEHAEEGLIPYVPELPIPSETIINYNQTVFNVRGIVTAPASLESTSLICVYGIDIYYTRVTPSKTFDILKDDFDHLLIMAVLLLLIIMSYLVKYLAAKKSLNAAWK